MEQKAHRNFIKLILRVPSTLRSTFPSIWLGASRTELCSVQITHHVEQVQYVEPQEDLIFLM
jgi:hypothetical protein